MPWPIPTFTPHHFHNKCSTMRAGCVTYVITSLRCIEAESTPMDMEVHAMSLSILAGTPITRILCSNPKILAPVKTHSHQSRGDNQHPSDCGRLCFVLLLFEKLERAERSMVPPSRSISSTDAGKVDKSTFYQPIVSVFNLYSPSVS